MFFRVFRAFRGSDTAWTTFLHIRVHSCPFVVLPLPPPSCFSCISWFKHCLDYVFAYSCPFVSIRVHSWFSLFHIPRDISCISCFSWFKHCLDDVFAYSCPFVVLPLPLPSCFSCPFVSIRGSPSSPSFVLFVVFVSIRGSNTAWTTFVSIRVHSWFSPFPLLHVFRGSNTAWTMFLSIRVHSCPFVVLPLHPPSCFFVYFVYFVVQTLLGLRFCIFVSIRVHSWFSLFPILRVFSCPFVSIRGSNTAWTTFLHIRVHSCPFVVLPLPHPSCFFVLFVV